MEHTEKKEKELEEAKKFVKLVKQLDERKQRALLHIIKGMAALSGKKEDILF